MDDSHPHSKTRTRRLIDAFKAGSKQYRKPRVEPDDLAGSKERGDRTTANKKTKIKTEAAKLQKRTPRPTRQPPAEMHGAVIRDTAETGSIFPSRRSASIRTATSIVDSEHSNAGGSAYLGDDVSSIGSISPPAPTAGSRAIPPVIPLRTSSRNRTSYRSGTHSPRPLRRSDSTESLGLPAISSGPPLSINSIHSRASTASSRAIPPGTSSKKPKAPPDSDTRASGRPSSISSNRSHASNAGSRENPQRKSSKKLNSQVHTSQHLSSNSRFPRSRSSSEHPSRNSPDSESSKSLQPSDGELSRKLLMQYVERAIKLASDERTKRRLERGKELLIKVGDWSHKIGIETGDIFYRTGRAIPGVGAFVATAAAVLNYTLVVLKDMRVNGQLANSLLDDTIYEVETCWLVLETATGRNEEVLGMLELFMKRIIDYCQTVLNKARQYQHKSFGERFLFREDIKREIDTLGKQTGYHIKQLEFFATIRSLTILVEEMSQRKENHQHVMDRLDEIENMLRTKPHPISITPREVSSSSTQTQTGVARMSPDFVLAMDQFSVQELSEIIERAKVLLQDQGVEKEKDKEEDKDGLLREISEIKEALESKDDITKILDIEEEEVPEMEEQYRKKKKEMEREKAELMKNEANMNAQERSSSNDIKMELHKLEKKLLDKRIKFAEKAIKKLSRIQEGKRPARNSATIIINGTTSESDTNNPAPSRDHNYHQRRRIQFDEVREPPTRSNNDSRSRVRPSFQTEDATEDADVRFFAKHLYHDYGDRLREPLWAPTVVKLGDVGYVSKRDGTFHKLFNALQLPPVLKKDHVKPLRDVLEEVKNIKMPSSLWLRSGMSIVKQEKAFGAINGKIKRVLKMPNHTGSEAAFMYLEKVRSVRYTDLTRPKNWFVEYKKTISKAYANDLGNQNLILVTGKLEARDYALLINRNKTNKQVRFYVFKDRKKGQKWGDFALGRSTYEKGNREHKTEELYKCSTNISNVQSKLDFTMHSVLLARLRFDERGKLVDN